MWKHVLIGVAVVAVAGGSADAIAPDPVGPLSDLWSDAVDGAPQPEPRSPCFGIPEIIWGLCYKVCDLLHIFCLP